MNHGKIHDIQFFSEALQEEMELLVYLPYNYTPLLKYSVLFASDGKDYFQYGRIGKVIDTYLSSEEIENVIVVGIPYKSVSERRRMYHPDGDRQKDYIRFLAHELVPYIDEHYPTYQIGGGRALIGDSLAATVSLQTALQYPNCFSRVILQSPYIDGKVLDAIENAKSPQTLSVYHIVGEGETEVATTADGTQDFLTPNREAKKLFENRGFPYFYEEFKGEHTWKYWQPDVQRAVKMVFGQ
ncbi:MULTISPECIES: alpha/beta hydrolase [Sporosarcina]|uniref:alpha/beta hydrolase n=1 Tax=Sporosarcina TaxID=1569 RepID=UPI000590FB7B|nr:MULTISPECIES: alpha/beta hydrolase-fold protein [Sporosarcina]WJY28912.1 alpha/beta hydrolase-fold protein [Sporosarcina sp. 0.2-SM1T-5]